MADPLILIGSATLTCHLRPSVAHCRGALWQNGVALCGTLSWRTLATRVAHVVKCDNGGMMCGGEIGRLFSGMDDEDDEAAVAYWWTAVNVNQGCAGG